MDLLPTIIGAAVAGLVGGVLTGVAAFFTMRVELRYLREDVHDVDRRITAHLHIDHKHS